MFIHLAVHYPKPEYAAELLASMQRVDKAAAGTPGLIRMGAWQDQRSDRLVGIAEWESEEAFRAAAERVFAVVADDPFDVWLTQPPDVYYLTQP